MTITESAIRDRAYQIWEAEGRPHGQDQRHWAQAENELVVEAIMANDVMWVSVGPEPIALIPTKPKPKRTRKLPGAVATPKRRKAEAHAH